MAKKDKNYKHFRKEFARDLEMLIQSLNSVFKEKGHEARSYFSDIPLRDAKSSIEADNAPVCTFQISGLRIPISDQRHLEPQGVSMPYIILNYSAALKLECIETDNPDPFENLYINVELKPENQPEDAYLCCGYHIDRWSEKDRVDKNEIHPIYHIHYCNASYYSCDEQKKVALSMDTPRLPYHPMDLFLAIAEVIGTYNKPAFEKLSKDPFFPKCCRKYSDKIVRPYYEMLLKSFTESRTGYITDYNPYFI